MTILRQSAMRELERLPEDKITFVLQIMRGINGLDEDERLAKKNAFKRLEHLRKKADINEDFSDFEDEKSEIKAISPSDFLKGELMH